MNNKKYKRTSTNVIDETIDSDTLIVNLSDGHYFSLPKSASIIWNLLMKNLSSQQIIDSFIAKFPGKKEIITLEIEQFIGRLSEEKLIVENKDEAVSFNTQNQIILLDKYSTPEISKFVDMEALLLADPIHELKNED